MNYELFASTKSDRTSIWITPCKAQPQLGVNQWKMKFKKFSIFNFQLK
jgi:hypothetical protein